MGFCICPCCACLFTEKIIESIWNRGACLLSRKELQAGDKSGEQGRKGTVCLSELMGTSTGKSKSAQPFSPRVSTTARFNEENIPDRPGGHLSKNGKLSTRLH